MNKRLTLTLLSTLLIGPAAFAADAGSVLFARGEVTAEREPPVSLAKGDAIEAGDEVVTGDSSRAQLLMLDGARIAVRPNSRLRIDEYAYTEPAAASVATSDDKGVMSLIKGGFRTITGAIGTENEADYEVRTPVGVLGIRGTDYTAVFCNGDCDWVPGVSPAAAIPDGLYLGVTQGVIVFRTTAQTIELAAGEYAFIPLNTPEPQKLDSPPAVLLEQNDLSFDAGDDSGKPQRDGGDDQSPSGFDDNLGTRRAPDSSAPRPESDESDDGTDSSSAPAQPTIAIDPDGNAIDITPGSAPDPQGPRTIAFSGPASAIGIPQNGAGINDPGQLRRDSNFNLEGFEEPFAGRTGADVVAFDIGTAGNIDTGFDSMTVLRWGRWSGGVMTATLLSDGSSDPIDLGQQSLHWIQGPEGTAPVMPIRGIANYTLIGSTSPTDNQGNVGTLGSATFLADFTSMLVDSTLLIDIAGSSWAAAGNGTIGGQAGLPAHIFQGIYNVTIDGVASGSGSFSGFFSGPGQTSDPAFPGGVGLGYSLDDPTGSITVSGSAAFGNP